MDAFDSSVVVEGRPVVVHSLLHARNRREIRDEVAAGRLTLEDGIVEVKGRIKGLDAEEARDLIHDAVRYADVLERPS